MTKKTIKKQGIPIKQYYKKIPKFYKDLGPEACTAYLRQKFKRKQSTAHWTLKYGDVKLVFWTIYWSRTDIMSRVKKLRKLTGKEYPRSILGLEIYSINKPWSGATASKVKYA